MMHHLFARALVIQIYDLQVAVQTEPSRATREGQEGDNRRSTPCRTNLLVTSLCLEGMASPKVITKLRFVFARALDHRR